MKNNTNKIKRMIICIAILVTLLIPAFKVDYYNGEGMEVRRYSVVTMVASDIKDGTLGTNYLK